MLPAAPHIQPLLAAEAEYVALLVVGQWIQLCIFYEIAAYKVLLEAGIWWQGSSERQRCARKLLPVAAAPLTALVKKLQVIQFSKILVRIMASEIRN
jgi:hypothetical protein